MQADSILLDLPPAALAHAVEANINAQIPLMYAHMPGVDIVDEADLLGMMSSRPDPVLNSVYWTAFPPDGIKTRIDRVLGRFDAQGRLPMTWIASPSSRPRNLGRYLESWGFSCVFRGVPGMAIDLPLMEESQPPPTDLAIECVASVEQLRQWLLPVTVSFGMREGMASRFFDLFAGQGFGPDVPWRLFVGLAYGQPVAASRLFCAAGAAGIFHVATTPAARGRGFGTAMALAALRAGQDLGYRIGILTASGDGYGIYRRLGFQDVCHADIFMGPQ